MAKRIPILCTDGTIISVQASSTHGCSPKSDEAFAYGAVEILIDKPNDPEGYNKVDKVESWCSAARLMRLIEMHGGIIGGQLPPLDFGNSDIVHHALHKIAVEGDAWWQAQQEAKLFDEQVVSLNESFNQFMKEEEGVDESE